MKNECSLTFVNAGLYLLCFISSSFDVSRFKKLFSRGGFVNGILMTVNFHQLAEEMPTSLLTHATVIVLIGCNPGGALSPYVLKRMGNLGEGARVIFSLFAMSCVYFALFAFWVIKGRKSDAIG